MIVPPEAPTADALAVDAKAEEDARDQEQNPDTGSDKRAAGVGGVLYRRRWHRRAVRIPSRPTAKE